MMGRSEYKSGTFAPGLPNRFRCLDTVSFCQLIFSQNDSVTVFRISTDRHGHIPVFRMKNRLYTGIKTIAVAMQNRSLHNFTLLYERAILSSVTTLVIQTEAYLTG